MPRDRSYNPGKNWLLNMLLMCALLPIWSAGADAAPESGYLRPAQSIADLIEAPPTPSLSLDPARQWMVLMSRPGLPSIADLAEPELRLAGARINPRTNGRSRVSHYNGLVLRRLADSLERPVVGLPTDPKIGSVRWSPDGKNIAFTITADDGISIWVAPVSTGQARKLTKSRLNALSGAAFEWLCSSKAIVCRLIPDLRGAVPAKSRVPAGPVIESNIGKTAPARTYQDLLKNPHDEALFEYYMTSVVSIVTLTGKVTALGSPAIISHLEPSPDGRFLLVETTHRPFSYLVPARRFPKRVEVWDLQGKVVRLLVDLPLADQIPVGFDSVRMGPRSFGWRADAPATLYWVEARDGGDPKKPAKVRDQLLVLAAPFVGSGLPLLSLSQRFRGVSWGDDRLALVSEAWWRTRTRRVWTVSPGKPTSSPRLLFDLSSEDRYGDPGRPLLQSTSAGTSVLLTADNGKTLFLSGRGASPEGDRPFLDKLEVATGKTHRLWRSQSPSYEWPVELIDLAPMKLVTRRESKDEPANYYLRDLQQGSIKQLTHFPHPQPQLRGVYKELIHYRRADGVELQATVYLPPGKKPADGPFPMLAWAYPREYKSASAAGQVSGSPHRFTRASASSPLLMLVEGYAVWYNFSLPVIGEGDKEPNDSFVEQLVAGAKAAVEEAVRRGLAERDRIAIGGHSYGAFMTANLLSHSDLFAAGIARSGAYNRTLTPFGFQAEERTFWQAPEIYFTMSPFMHAHRVNEPILLIHGEADNNSGTFPIQSQRYYHALKGHGVTARLVLLPHESHGYRSSESLLHVAAETAAWLDKYVKKSD